MLCKRQCWENRRLAKDWEKILTKDISNKWLIKNIERASNLLRKQTTWFKNILKGLTDTHQNRHTDRKQVYEKRCSTLYVIREVQIKTVTRYHYIVFKIPKIQSTDNTKCWQRYGTEGILIHCWWKWKWYSHFGK